MSRLFKKEGKVWSLFVECREAASPTFSFSRDCVLAGGGIQLVVKKRNLCKVMLINTQHKFT